MFDAVPQIDRTFMSLQRQIFSNSVKLKFTFSQVNNALPRPVGGRNPPPLTLNIDNCFNIKANTINFLKTNLETIWYECYFSRNVTFP